MSVVTGSPWWFTIRLHAFRSNDSELGFLQQFEVICFLRAQKLTPERSDSAAAEKMGDFSAAAEN